MAMEKHLRAGKIADAASSKALAKGLEKATKDQGNWAHVSDAGSMGM